jgi:phosphatidylglycerol:prolipoprotein diacylglycerol transferase
MLQNGGLAIWGALAGGGVAAIIYARVNQLSPGRLFDVLVPALLAAQIIGRFACIIDGDATGVATDLPWGFIYTNPDAMVPANLWGIATHPYPIYDQLWNLAGLAMVLKLRRYLKIDGFLFLSYLVYYAIGRLVLTFVRHEADWFLGLQEAQVIAAATLIASMGILFLLYRKNRHNLSGQA